jgi:PAS domain S-box-containing protein
MQGTDAHRGKPPDVDEQRRAWLTYKAMDRSDNIVLLLETKIADKNTDAVVAAANDAFLRASGYSEGQLLGRPFSDFLPTGPRAEKLRETIRRAGSLRGEDDVLRADGSKFTLGFHLMPVPESEASPHHSTFLILGRDITETLVARNLQTSIQKLLAQVFTSIDEAVAIIDDKGRVALANPQMDKLLGYKPNTLVGRMTADIVARSGHEVMATNVRIQMQEGRRVSYEVPVLREDGTEQQMNISSVMIERGDSKKFRIVTLRPAARTALRSESAGRITLVGLEEVRDALGDRWPAMAARASATAEAVIKRRCGNEDSYSRVDEVSFLICFGALDVQEASFRAAMIGREIRDRLIGQGSDPATAQVRAIAASVKFPSQEEQPTPDRHATLLAGLDGQMQQIEQDARQTLKTTLFDARCDLEPIRGRDIEETVCSLVRLPDAVERKVLCAFSVLTRDETDAFDLDGLLLTLAAMQATTMLARGEARPLLVPLSFEVFNSRIATERYIRLCRKVDQRLTKLLIFLLFELPEGLPKSRLFECVNLIRPFCSGVGYQVDDPAMLAAVDLAPSGHGIVVLPQSAVATMPAAKLKALINFVHAKRMKLLIRHLGSTNLATQMLAQGADLISMTRVVA